MEFLENAVLMFVNRRETDPELIGGLLVKPPFRQASHYGVLARSKPENNVGAAWLLSTQSAGGVWQLRPFERGGWAGPQGRVNGSGQVCRDLNSRAAPVS